MYNVNNTRVHNSKFDSIPNFQKSNFHIFNCPTFNLLVSWNSNCLKFQLFGPNLLLGRTFFSANHLLGAYCILCRFVVDLLLCLFGLWIWTGDIGASALSVITSSGSSLQRVITTSHLTPFQLILKEMPSMVSRFMAPRWHQGTIAPKPLKRNKKKLGEKCPKANHSFEGVVRA